MSFHACLTDRTLRTSTDSPATGESVHRTPAKSTEKSSDFDADGGCAPCAPCAWSRRVRRRTRARHSGQCTVPLWRDCHTCRAPHVPVWFHNVAGGQAGQSWESGQLARAEPEGRERSAPHMPCRQSGEYTGRTRSRRHSGQRSDADSAMTVRPYDECALMWCHSPISPSPTVEPSRKHRQDHSD